ncbi:hypothetical protein Tco_0521333, partial [Tanacetum coccineum]
MVAVVVFGGGGWKVDERGGDDEDDDGCGGVVMGMAAGVWGSDGGNGHEGGVIVAAVGRQPEEME